MIQDKSEYIIIYRAGILICDPDSIARIIIVLIL